jgi:hypothetical protein
VADIVTGFKPVVIAIGEGGEGQVVGSRNFAHTTAGGDSGDEGDMRSQANEALGELEARIDMALGRKCYDEEVGAGHDGVAVSACENGTGLHKSVDMQTEGAEGSHIKDEGIGVMTFVVTIWRTA